ncbi:hypothetical protein EXU48_14025 [Occultella glacieicola]|uniref:Uncharacterized protein n=1 Tax=Occultella glacieicola TaxID=2518684 RepID=A0ABY2E227_9MICO|nr:hypothetical protein [Occultella glacieicola]TDE92650.1 hypothetical protein EXU48_14025 [Occultella glacieicola]
MTITHDPLEPSVHINVGALGVLVALILLVAGPQPRLATKWAWFWLGCAGPLWLVFLVLEPVPWWRRESAMQRDRRLTGGWAFLASIFLVPVVLSLIPGLQRIMC